MAKEKVDTEKEIKDEKIVIILRGFPGAGKSSLTKAIKTYFGESKCISCSFDKYHWSGKEEGKGQFKFDKSIHKNSKKWCRQEILQSIQQSIPNIIVDNANFEKWEYADFINWAQNYKYKVLIIEIKSETKSISRQHHIKHMNESKENKDCLLCKMQYHRCKMHISDYILKIFINKYQTDSNAIIVNPKLNDNEYWTNDELKLLLSSIKPLNMDLYNDDQYKLKQQLKSNKRKNNDPLNYTLDEMISNERNKYQNNKYRNKRRRYNGYHRQYNNNKY